MVSLTISRNVPYLNVRVHNPLRTDYDQWAFLTKTMAAGHLHFKVESGPYLAATDLIAKRIPNFFTSVHPASGPAADAYTRMIWIDCRVKRGAPSLEIGSTGKLSIIRGILDRLKLNRGSRSCAQGHFRCSVNLASIGVTTVDATHAPSLPS